MDRAQTVLDAFDSQRLIGPLSDEDPSFDEAAAYEVLEKVHARRMDRGERPVGRKIGFTNRGLWPHFGVDAPIWAYMYDSTVAGSSAGEATVEVGHLLQPRIEPEIQLHFARAPRAADDEEEILDCIDWVAQGFELVQCPFPDWRFRAADAIAACGIHGALVVGTPVRVADVDDCAAKLRSFSIALLRDGAEQATGTGANALGSPLLAFAHLAEVLGRQSRFPPVEAGEIVTTGTLTDPLPVAAGDTWSTTLDGIELPGLTVRIV